MASNSDRPFGHDTLKVPAVFVPEDAKDGVSSANISRTLGFGSLKIPAVFVPEGGVRPDPSYQYFGKAEFSSADDGNDGRTVTSQQPSWQSPGASSPSPDSVWQSQNSSSHSLNSSSQSLHSSSQSLDSSRQPPDSSLQSPATQQASDPGTMLPRTRHRFGAAQSGSPSVPPNPSLTGGKSDPVGKGVQSWLAMKDAARTAMRAVRKQVQQRLQIPPR